MRNLLAPFARGSVGEQHSQCLHPTITHTVQLGPRFSRLLRQRGRSEDKDTLVGSGGQNVFFLDR